MRRRRPRPRNSRAPSASEPSWRHPSWFQAPGGGNYVYLVYQPANAPFSHAVLVYGVERAPPDALATNDVALVMNPMISSVPAYLFLSDLVGKGVLIASVAGI